MSEELKPCSFCDGVRNKVETNLKEGTENDKWRIDS